MPTASLATAFVNIVPGTQALENYLKGKLPVEVDQATRTMGQRLKGGLMPILGGLGVAFGAVGVVNFAKDMYASAVQGEKTDAVLSNISKSMGLFGKGTDTVVTRLKDYATAQMKLTGIDDDVIKAAQAKLMTFSKVASSADVMGGSFDRTTGLAADLAAAGFGSMDSAAVMLGKALQDPEKGLTALQRVGVSLSEKQKKQVKDFMAVNNIAGAQKVILGEVERQVGGTATASATAGEKMKARWEDAVQSLGTTLMPVFEGIIGFINDTFVPAMENASGAVKGFFGWFSDNKAWLVPVLAGVAGALAAIGINAAVAGIAAGIAAAGGFIPMAIATWAWTAALLANPITWIVLGIGLVIGAVVALAMNWDAVTKWVGDVWNGFVGWLKDGLKAVAKWWSDMWAGIGRFFKDTWTNITNFFTTVWNNITNFLTTVFKNLVSGIQTFLGNIVKFFVNLPGNILKVLSGAAKWLVDTGKNIIVGLFNGLKNAATAIGKWFTDIGKSWIQGFKSLFGIHSPSKVFTEFGKNIMQGLHAGLISESKSVVDAMAKVSDWLVSAFDSKKISATQKAAGLALVKAYTGQLKSLESQQNSILEKLKTAQDELANKITEKADYIASLSEKLGATLTIELPTDTSVGTTASSAIADLKARLSKTLELKSVTEKLKALGLKDSLYKQIVESQAVDFGKSILDAGVEAVQQLNVLSDQADSAALDMAGKVGDTLFDQGIRFAESVVEGFKKQKSALESVMDSVASAFERQISAIISNNKFAISVALTSANSLASTAVKVSTATQPEVSSAYVSAANAAGYRVGATGHLIALAAGGFVNQPTRALIGEAGPEVVTPLKDFERMMGLSKPKETQVVNYYAAPNKSIDAEADLRRAMLVARLI
jgi:hypothetical protein